MLTISEALNLLELEGDFSLIQLKDAYRRMMKQWHPDLNPDRLELATETCQRINAAYDLLESTSATRQGGSLYGRQWSEWVERQMPRWEREFKLDWARTYQKVCTQARSGDRYASLHFHTLITNWRRQAIEPRPEWFRNCLFKDTPKNRAIYRELLLKIAPNQKLREGWAKKYFALEFGETTWVFYLPSSRALLTAEVV